MGKTAGLIILSTAPDLKSAGKIAKSLVTRKLAACVSMRSGFISTYRWKGKLERSEEVLVLIKTLKRQYSEVEKAIRSMHPYGVPEVLAIPVSAGSKDYLSWMLDAVQ